MKKIITALLLIASLQQSYGQKILFGIFASHGGVLQDWGYGFEFGAIEKDSATGWYASFEIGSGKHSEARVAPSYQDYPSPHGDIRDKGWYDEPGETIASVHGGFVPLDKIAVGLSLGMSFHKHLHLFVSNATGWYYLEDESTTIRGAVGGEVRGLFGPIILTTGWENRRGFRLGLAGRF